VFLEIPRLLDRLCYRFPSLLIDSVIEHEPGTRLVAVKNVTGNEEVLQGHFPGTPVIPGVLMIEALVQAASVLLLDEAEHVQPSAMRTVLRGVNNARFRRLVVPGDQIRLEVTIRRRRRRVAVAAAVARVGDHVVAEAELLIGLALDEALIDPTANVAPGAEIGAGTVIGPNVVVGPYVRIGRACNIGASAVIDGWTEIGDETQVFPFASIGLIPQDQKFKGERTSLVIGRRNIFREFVTIHRGTEGGGGVTRIGDDNLFMAYVHVAHDCEVGHRTIFGNAATLSGHVSVEDQANIGAFSGVHQFCRVGRQAFIGGYSVVTLDALPFVRSVGNRARVYDLNVVGLERQGMPEGTVAELKRAFRYLLQSKLNTTQALHQIEQDDTLQCAEVVYLVEFIRTSRRGVNLRRPPKRLEAMVADE
jgi:UDP-N-acetylglucosamine acyltransferase|tara:strand:+ start:19171 stop:20430 length:1260 start_codon:yes stop_codon:yes gene_type:complete